MKKIVLIVTLLFIIIATSALTTVILSPSTTSSNSSNVPVPTPGAVALTDNEEERIQLIANAEKAVVSVIVTKDIPKMESFFENRQSPFPGFEQFFGGDPFMFQIPQYRQNGTEKKEIGGGTAFFISADGLLLTNKHVINDEEAEYTILLNDEKKLDAEVVATDPNNDIAILQVKGSDFPYITLASEPARVGQTAIAIGNALGEFRNTVSIGIVSGLKRNVTARSVGTAPETLDQIIQTDTAINQGNSGGPLLNSRGEAIGMNTAIAANAQNIGFAIPASDLQKAIDSYQKNGKIVSAYMGIRYTEITPSMVEKNKLDTKTGILVSRGETADDLAVVPNSPAAKAGIVEGDIITKIDGAALDKHTSLSRVIARKKPGDTIVCTIIRNGKEKEVSVILEERK